MSLDAEAALRRFFASAPQNVRQIEVLQISHSAMSKTYYLWREPYTGTVATESGVRTVQPVNMEIEVAGSEGNLDQEFHIRIDTTDVEDELREQLDRIPVDTEERIRCVYRVYMSDDLTDIVAGPMVLQAESISHQVGACAITAVSPRLNTTSTGDRYVPREVPMLRGFR